MIRTIWSAFKQAISGKKFIFCIIATVAITGITSLQQILEAFRTKERLIPGFHYLLIEKALSSDEMTLALPILVAIPFTASFVDDVKSGFIKSYLYRTSKKGYLTSKSVACAVSGGLVVAIGIITAYILATSVFLHMEAPLQEDSGAPMFLTELMKKVLLFFLSGAFWSMIGLLFAALMNSRYMAYASPFILYYVLIILCERYFSSFYIIYPKEWTAPSSMWICGMSGVVVLLVGLIIFLSHIFNIIAKGRLNQI